MFEGIAFGLYSTTSLRDEEKARAALARLLAMPTHLRPKRFGRFDPVGGRGDTADMQTLVDAWLEPVGGPEAEVARSGYVSLDVSAEDGYSAAWEIDGLNAIAGGFSAEALGDLQADVEALMRLLLDLAPIVETLYGSIRRMDDYWAIPMNLTVRLPNVPWLSIYGPPYVEMFGEERIFDAPFWKVWKLDSGHVVAQLTEHIDDDYGEPERKAVREFLGADAFLEGKNRPRHYKTGRVPKVFDK